MKLMTDLSQINLKQVNLLLKRNGNTERSALFWHEALSKTTKIFALIDSDKTIKAFMRLVDDNQMCLIHDFYMDNDKKTHESIVILFNHLFDYIKEKNFLYTEIFNCPASIVVNFQAHDFKVLDTGMVFNAGKFKEENFETNGLDVCFDVNKVNPVGVNDIFDAVGWGGRDMKMWQQILPRTSFVVQVSLKDKVLGFARLVDDGHMGMVYDVCVLPDFQKKKIGSLIMSKMSTYLKQRNLAFVGLVVAHENKTARFFYEKFGFKSVPGVLQHYRGD